MFHTPIFLDVETNGKGTFRPPKQRVIQMGWIVGETFRNYYVKGCAHISSGAFMVHGITVEHLEQHGYDYKEVLDVFIADIKGVENPIIVAHNCAFDIGCMLHTLELEQLDHDTGVFIATLQQICTMMTGTDVCKLPGLKGGYKYPKLTELCQHMDVSWSGVQEHDALQDAMMLKCAFEKGIRSNQFSLRMQCE